MIRGARRGVKQAAGSRMARTPAARSLFFWLAGGYSPVLLSDIGLARFYVDTSDEGIGRRIFLHGSFEFEWVEKTFALLQSFGHAEFHGKAFVDVGANIGTTCIPVVQQYGFARAFAFEPAPRSFALLQQNIAANGLREIIRAFPVALSSENAEVDFELDPQNPGDHRVRVNASGPETLPERQQESRRHVVTVAARTFDSFVAEGVLRPEELGVVWMDAQGHEGHILAGAQTLLQSPAPVLLEFWPYGLRRAGGLELLEEIIARHYTHFVDVRVAEPGGRDVLTPTSEIGCLKKKYRDTAYTDVLLLK